MEVEYLPETKVCSRCEQEKSGDEFCFDCSREDGFRKYCRECCRKYQLQHHYNITTDEYTRKLKEQNGVCAICQRPETSKDSNENNGRIKDLAVDHNGITGVNRGLLCQKCNIGLGHFNHNPKLLREAANYMEKYQ